MLGSGFSALQRAEIAEIVSFNPDDFVTVLVSVLFNEPKLLKFRVWGWKRTPARRFSALQRAEIAEIKFLNFDPQPFAGFSALQRAEIAEIWKRKERDALRALVSVLFNEPKLLKFESAEPRLRAVSVSVLFNEPKLLKYFGRAERDCYDESFSALQRAEIAEIFRSCRT